jgi:Domain of Unknown Function (DUF1080)
MTGIKGRWAAPFAAWLLIGCWSAAGASTGSPQNVLTAAEVADGWKLLFDGKSIDDWKASEAPGTFSVKDGEIIVHGPRSHLYYLGPVQQHNFRNFELTADVWTGDAANSGIYFHTHWQPAGWPDEGFEVQINNSHSDTKRTAGLYDVKDVYDHVAPDHQWFRMGIRVEGKHVVTTVNGKVIVDWTEPVNWVPPEGHPGRRIASGTFALQGHNPEGEIHFRNIKVHVLP